MDIYRPRGAHISCQALACLLSPVPHVASREVIPTYRECQRDVGISTRCRRGTVCRVVDAFNPAVC